MRCNAGRNTRVKRNTGAPFKAFYFFYKLSKAKALSHYKSSKFLRPS